jgi:hypothetical protein
VARQISGIVLEESLMPLGAEFAALSISPMGLRVLGSLYQITFCLRKDQVQILMDNLY